MSVTSPDRSLDELVAAARQARQHAYAPYSRFAVGAAVLMASGRVFAGANVENASFGLTMCAERVAIGAAVAAGEREIRAVAVVTDAVSPTPPCGACRQVIQELGPGAVIVAQTERGDRCTWTIGALLPSAFGSEQLR